MISEIENLDASASKVNNVNLILILKYFMLCCILRISVYIKNYFYYKRWSLLYTYVK